MAEVLVITTRDWELSVWAAKLGPKQQKQQRMLQKRGLSAAPCRLHLQVPHLEKVLASVNGQLTEIDLSPEHSSHITVMHRLSLPEPLFFENQFYQFEWIFNTPVTDAHIQHRLQTVADSFRFNTRTQSARLTGTLNTRNDIGWLPLHIGYQVAERWHENAINIEVSPVKLAMQHDLAVMYRDINSEYAMWLFSVARQTQQDVASRREREFVPLFWWQMFEALKEELFTGLTAITASPHNRLLEQTRHLTADRVKGKLSTKLAEKIRNDMQYGQYTKRYLVQSKHLSVNTPENQFIKYAVQQILRRLQRLHVQLSSLLKESNIGLSSRAVDKLATYQQPLRRFLHQGFMRDVQSAKQSAVNSLVLQQKPGYSKVYRAWLRLMALLDVWGDTSKVSMKSIDKVYEVWCFLKLKRILIDALGFALVPPENQLTFIRQGFEVAFNHSEFRDYHFTREDGVAIRLQLTPSFRKSTTSTSAIRTYLHTQEPDLLLEVTYPNNAQFTWLFDAKYRVDSKNSDIDLVPKDAINELHRYRDALIHVRRRAQYGNVDYTEKTRPVFGAFALYPGHFDQATTNNPYQTAIDEVNIGAFALLPTEMPHSSDVWLRQFLQQVIGIQSHEHNHSTMFNASVSNNLIQDAARIPAHNMKTVAFSELTLTAALGAAEERSEQYLRQYVDGSARWYHIPVSVFERQFAKLIIEEIRFLALVVNNEHFLSKEITHLWPIKSVQCCERSTLTIEQTGKLSDSNELYWVFELDRAYKFDCAITVPFTHSFTQQLKLTTLDRLNSNTVFTCVEEVYFTQ